MMQETQLLPHRRNLQDLLCDSSLYPKAYIYVICARYWLFIAHILGVCFKKNSGMIPYPEPDQTMFQQRRLGALGVEWRPSSIKFSVGPDFSLGQDYIMPPLADLDRLIEPLPEFIDAMYWEPEHEVLSDDNDSEYNAEVSSDGAKASPCSNSSNELECSSEDSDVENIYENSSHRKRRRQYHRVCFVQLLRFFFFGYLLTNSRFLRLMWLLHLEGVIRGFWMRLIARNLEIREPRTEELA